LFGFAAVKFRPLKQAPVLIAAGVIALVCLVRILNFRVFDSLERRTYDWRVRAAQHFPQPAATNLGFVFISDESITALNRGLLGNSYGLLWPRHIYGRLIRELSAQDARAVAFDVLFAQLRVDHASVLVSTTRWPDIVSFLTELHPGKSQATYQDQGDSFAIVESDDFLAWQLKRAGMGILAAENEVLPHSLFATNALALADISADRDPDGVLRRAKAFRVYRRWHPAFKQAESDYGADLASARVEPGQIILPLPDDEEAKVPIDADANFSLADFGGESLPPGMPERAKAFVDERVWHMGIVVAARELKLDLANADVNLKRRRITFRGADGTDRVLPVDRDGYIYINWELTAGDQRLTKESIESLLAQDLARSENREEGLTNRWRGKLVVVGSSATGNNLTDRGATPLEKDTLLVSKHWNVANSLITGRFVSRSSLATDFMLIVLLGAVTALLTWRLRVFTAAGGVFLIALAYCGVGLFLYVQYRYWIPLVLPVIGAMLVEHGLLVTYRVVFEQRERRRLRSVFDKMLSPHVAREVLKMDTLLLGGSRREITVLFSDIRGFTQLTDATYDRASKIVEQRKLTGLEAEAVFDEQAREMLDTVNRYLSLVADIVKQHDGTLDKYIGDCVMAYWGAPTPNPQHALHCVRAAIDAQRAIHDLNQNRREENRRREQENLRRAEAGLSSLPLLAMLSLGSGINSGVAVAGLMGSEDQLSYTVFGREVNLASRLETVSGHGRIIIGEATYKELLRDDPDLAARCVEQEPTTPKGFQKPVRNFEVPWQTAGTSQTPA
jgi:class 3 adenylate cyclase